MMVRFVEVAQLGQLYAAREMVRVSNVGNEKSGAFFDRSSGVGLRRSMVSSSDFVRQVMNTVNMARSTIPVSCAVLSLIGGRPLSDCSTRFSEAPVVDPGPSMEAAANRTGSAPSSSVGRSLRASGSLPIGTPSIYQFFEAVGR